MDFQRYSAKEGAELASRRVPSKGETKITPPFPGALQHLVGLPTPGNEDVYRALIAQQYCAALSALPAHQG